MSVYHGNCHCGAFKFTFTTPTELTQAVSCDCSLCSQEGYLAVLARDGEFQVTKGDIATTLSSYSYGKRQWEHKFCKKCGTSVLVHANGNPSTLASVNLRVIENIDLSAISLNTDFKGSQVGPAFSPPSTPPTPRVPPPTGATVYSGGCHCGAVAYTLVQPSKISALSECNCSICTRHATLWAYIAVNDLTLRGDDTNSTEYEFATRQVKHTFCKTCGVLVYLRFAGAEGTVVDPANRALNVRTLDGVDLESFEVKKVDGKAYPPLYVVPE